MSSHPFLSGVAVILAEPENPDNIGAAARAMKNMGFEDLRLVRPPKAWRSPAKKMAMSACDLLEKAAVFQTFEAAVADRTFVVGTTRRQGPKRGVFLPFFEMIQRIQKMDSPDRPAVVFGKESKGLNNQTLRLCDWVTTIPTHCVYPSLNVAQSVMTVLFSLFSFQTASSATQLLKFRELTGARFSSGKAYPFDSETSVTGAPALVYLSKDQVEDVLERFKAALRALGYQSGGADKLNRIIFTLRDLIKRSGLLEREAQMLRGLSRRILEKS